MHQLRGSVTPSSGPARSRGQPIGNRHNSGSIRLGFQRTARPAILRSVNAFHLFTLRGIPVFASPFYFLLLLVFARGDLMRGIIWGICITLSLLTHELGHAFVARYLRHDPSIMLHGFGGLTSRSRTGRDVEEATIIAMGPAAGLALGLLVYGAWQLLMMTGIATQVAASVVYALLYPCIVWNLLNLVPLWPLDGGQLFRLGLMRWVSARQATRITHIVALVLLAGVALYALRVGSTYTLLLLALLAFQNVQALRAGGARETTTPAVSSVAQELVDNAQLALREGRFKDAARLGHQARAQDGVPQALIDRIWEILGVATSELGEYEEALTYLRRARPSERVRAATRRSLDALGREDEIEEVVVARWEPNSRGRNMKFWLLGTIGFIVLAISMVFITPLSQFVF
jgi:stage IV sporulation protein FB